MTRSLSVSAAIVGLLAAGAASAQSVDCMLTIVDFEDNQIEQAATCDVVDDGAILEFLGVIEENDATFEALANRDEGTALLIGAGTFFLVSGEAEVSDDAMVWPNGYAVRLSR